MLLTAPPFLSSQPLLTNVFLVNAGLDDGTNIIYPLSIEAGDLLILCDWVTGGSTPTDVIPTGWTGITTVSDATSRMRWSYRIADGTESGDSVDGMGLTTERKHMFQLRGNKKIVSFSVKLVSTGPMSTNPALQTLSNTGLQGPSVGIVNFASSSNVLNASALPDEIVEDWDFSVTDEHLISYVWIYPTSPQTITWDMDDSGNNNTLLGAYFSNFRGPVDSAGRQSQYTISYRDSAGTTTDSGTYSFSGMDIGASGSDPTRKAIICVYSVKTETSGLDCTAVTVGGISATKRVSHGGYLTRNLNYRYFTHIWEADISTLGSTATVVCQYNGTARCGAIHVYESTGAMYSGLNGSAADTSGGGAGGFNSSDFGYTGDTRYEPYLFVIGAGQWNGTTGNFYPDQTHGITTPWGAFDGASCRCHSGYQHMASAGWTGAEVVGTGIDSESTSAGCAALYIQI